MTPATDCLDMFALAHALLDAGWCQRHFAQNEKGVSLGSLDDEATRFCLHGALERAAHELGLNLPGSELLPLGTAEIYHGALRKALYGSPSTNPIWLNDAPGTSAQDVLDFLCDAAAWIGKR